MTENTDHNLLRCTVKKSLDVVQKLILWASYAIVGLAGLVVALYGAIALYGVLVTPTASLAMQIYELVASGFSAVISLLSLVPWYVYIGIAVIGAIPTYSFLWCVARELTEEDWKSDEAHRVTPGIGIIGIVIGVCGIGIAIGIAAVTGEVLVDSYGSIMGIIGIIIVFIHDTRPALFPGAYLHYRKRMKEAKE